MIDEMAHYVTSEQAMIFLLSLIPLWFIAHWYDQRKHHSLMAKGCLGTSLGASLAAFLSVTLSASLVLVGVVLFGLAHLDRMKVNH